MNKSKLTKIIFTDLKNKLEARKGLSIFARERSKFEGWLKVELCDTLLKYTKNVIPEKLRIDVSFDNWFIELKTVNTNIRYPNVKNKIRPITKNVKGVIDDIKKLQKINCKNKAVLFVVFPVNHENNFWQKQLKCIKKHLSYINQVTFNFSGEIPGVMYFGIL